MEGGTISKVEDVLGWRLIKREMIGGNGKAEQELENRYSVLIPAKITFLSLEDRLSFINDLVQIKCG